MPSTAVDLPSAGPFDPTTPEFLDNPYAKFRELREKTPICIHPATGLCFLLRFDDVEAGLTNITRGHEDGNLRHVHFPGNPFAADGPGHTGPRRVIMPTFSNRGVQRFRERAQQIVDLALAGKERGGECASSMRSGFPLPTPHCGSRCAEADTSPSCATGRGRARMSIVPDAGTMKGIPRSLGHLASHLREVIECYRAISRYDVVSAVISAADAGEVCVPSRSAVRAQLYWRDAHHRNQLRELARPSQHRAHGICSGPTSWSRTQ